MPLRVSITNPKPGYHIVALNGQLDSKTTAAAESQLAPLLSGKAKVVLLDLTFLDYISSLGVRLILKARKALESQNARLIISNLQPQIAKVFEVVKALPPQAIFASLAEADRYFDVIQRQALAQQPPRQ